MGGSSVVTIAGSGGVERPCCCVRVCQQLGGWLAGRLAGCLHLVGAAGIFGWLCECACHMNTVFKRCKQ